MRSARTVAAEPEVALALWLRPPGWEDVEEAEEEVEDPWMTRLNQCSTVGCGWYGDEVAIRPCRRSDPSSSDAEEVSVWDETDTSVCVLVCVVFAWTSA